MKSFSLTTIAATDEHLGDFAPYAASINDAGTVAFQATLRDGRTGVFTGSGGSLSSPFEQASLPIDRFYSHPDIDDRGALCVYAALANGEEWVLQARHGAVIAIAGTDAPFKSIGPLGPTMNDHGTVAFRADTTDGRRGVFTGRRGEIAVIADTPGFAGFQGLPAITGRGTVVFRADLLGGGHGLYRSRGEAPEAIVLTGDRFRTLGFFPSVNEAETVVFSATLQEGGAGIFCAEAGEIRTIIDTDSGFESFRGALINDAGTVFFYATPGGGQMGIYAGPDPVADVVLRIGDPLFGSTVVDFALNPVSINAHDQLAIRLRLANDEQRIVRVDPAK